MKFITKAVHIGSDPDSATGAIMPPIYMSSTFAVADGGHGYDYTRADNPNFRALESMLAALEGGEYATVFSSGLGALTALLSTLSQGARVLTVGSLYGGTFRLLHAVFEKFGLQVEHLGMPTPQELERAMEPAPALLLFETPTNPLLEILDIEACTKIAKRHGVLTVVDNTFASPYCQNPLKWGADVVWHSTTKYIGGHSDIIGGVLISNSATLKREFDFMRKAIGVNPSPFDCWLTQRGAKTLALRLERQQYNAARLAEFLEGHPKTLKVHYPGLADHPQHALAKKQMSGFGGMLSAEFNISEEGIAKLMKLLTIFTMAESLGGIESLISHPATMTHASIPPDVRMSMGITDGLVRFSVGIEDAQDLIDDINQALEMIN
jgi:cystathionine gamma-lyase/cystathionine beta-lyase